MRSTKGVRDVIDTLTNVHYKTLAQPEDLSFGARGREGVKGWHRSSARWKNKVDFHFYKRCSVHV